MTQSQPVIWLIIVLLGLGTFLIRFSFLGFVGDRPLPNWFTRLLRYVGVAIMPGLVAPLILWPEASGGQIDPSRLLAACVAVVVGIWTRNAIWAIISGFAVLYLALWVL